MLSIAVPAVPRLTFMHNRLEREVATLDVEREFVNMHLAGA